VAEHFKDIAVKATATRGSERSSRRAWTRGTRTRSSSTASSARQEEAAPAGKAIPKVAEPKTTEKPAVKPDKLKTEADHVAKSTGAMEGKKIGGKIKKK